MVRLLTVGEVALRLGVLEAKVRALFRRGLLPEPPRIGTYRAIGEDQLPAVKAALVKAVYLAPAETGAAE